MKRKLHLVILLLCITAVSAQQKLKTANRLFNEMAYVDAAKAYEEYLGTAKQPGTGTITNIADSYYYIGNTAKALKWFNKLYDVSGTTIDDLHFRRYINILRASEQYGKADDLSRQRLAKKGNAAMMARFTRQKKYLDSINATTPVYTVTGLASNTNKADFGTAFYENKIVYSSAKDTTKLFGKTYKWNEQPYLELYVADRNAADGSFSNEEKFAPKDLNSYHNATLVFSPDHKTVYYSTNTLKRGGFLNNADDGTNNLQILKAVIGEGRFVNIEKLAFNNKNYSVGHPALTADGKWLFFTSDMPGGFGETDIYVAPVGENGAVGKPKNLGDKINTAGREMFPFINDSVLYFSSDGHYGLGGLDIFQSRVTGDLQFSEPENMGRPVNSNFDDFAFIIDKGEAYGYLSSNRKGGKGDDDIYYFTKKPPVCRHIVSGRVIHKKYRTAINQADVKVYDEAGALFVTMKTGENGKYSFEVPCNAKLSIEASKPGHTTDKKEVTTTSALETKDVDLELATYEDLVKKEDDVEKIDIKPIFFDLDKYDIRPEAYEELDKVVSLMKNFPMLVIKIESHTDSRASDDYNLTLSENRAKATYNYILSKGIAPERIDSVKGYGETRLRNKCSNGVPCSEEEHQMNRRSDFIVVKR